MPPRHDCEYIRQRNSLIKEAERIATGQCGNADPYGWTKVFVTAPDKNFRKYYMSYKSPANVREIIAPSRCFFIVSA